MTSLLAVAREKFLEAIRSVKLDAQSRWKVLVLDEHSQRLLYNVLSRDDILSENVSAIFLNSDRQFYAQEEEEAMYLLMPTTRNIERIIAEFSNGNRQFRRVHLYFTDGLSEELFTRLTQSSAEPYLACVTELYINYWPLEAQTFSIESPSMFFSIFSPARNAQTRARERLLEDLRFTARHITNLCISLNEFPYIRYYTPSHHAPLGPLAPTAAVLPPPPSENSTRWRSALARGATAREYEAAENEFVSRPLAFMVQGMLEEYVKNNPDFPKKSPRPRGTLVITDRSMDTVAPFLHEFTYQAMANDLLPIQDGVRYLHAHRNKVGQEEREDVQLNDSDAVWVDVRHMHMREAIDKLMSDFNKFLQENTSFTGKGPANLESMRDMIATLPQYQSQLSKLSLHLSMAEKCMNTFERDNLPSLGTIEQNCATGLTAEGKTPKTLVEEMVPVLDSKDVHNLNKLRIIALYVQYREGVPEEDRRRLCQHARLKMAEIDALGSLAHLGVRVTRTPADKDIRRKLKAKPPADGEYDLSRYKPVLQTVLDDHVAGKLDPIIFPYVKDAPLQGTSTSTVSVGGVGVGVPWRSAAPSPSPTPPQPTSLRSTRAQWHKAPRPGAAGTAGPGAAPAGPPKERLIAFVAGGMTYSEMRAAYMRSAALNKDVIIGSTHAWTPTDFMDDLKVLELEGVGSRSAPNGVRREPVDVFQRYYDEHYFQPEPAPPRTASAPATGAGAPRFLGGLRGDGSSLTVPGSAPGLQPSQSLSSIASADSLGPGGEKKKKRGFFRF